MTGAGHNGDPREASDVYSGEVYRVGAWRVAVCRGGLQWLIQRQRLSGARAGEWDSLSYCRSREAVVRLWARDTGDDGASLLAVMPEHITDLCGAARGASAGHAA